MTATPRSGEGHDLSSDGTARPDCVDRIESGQTTTVTSAPTRPVVSALPVVTGQPDRETGQPDHEEDSSYLLSARSRLITILLGVSLLYVIVDVVVQGPLVALDERLVRWDGEKSIPSLDGLGWAYDKVGQRSVLLPILLIVAGVLARRHGTWRPLVLAGLSFLAINVVVGAMKIMIGRGETETLDPSVLSGGMIFPSGHSSNMVLTGGVIVYLVRRYVERPPLKRLVAAVSVLTLLTCVDSIYLGSHWLSDLIGGVLVGGLLCFVVIVFDRKTAAVDRNRVRSLVAKHSRRKAAAVDDDRALTPAGSAKDD